ncbi:hypothetical protein DF18_13975 [Streptomyces rimosus]|nr:hypothetical protein DF18_13975 [Streptomyces rimosus]QEV77555.1 hypothetical protein CP984_23430 [Streptomyces rimosus]
MTMAAANGSNGARQVPPPPNYPPTNGRAPAPVQRNRNTKIQVNKVNLLPDGGILPPLTLSFSKTVVNGGGSGSGRRKALPGSGFTSDEDVRALSEAIRKDARPRAVERALDAETLEAVLRTIPDTTGSMSGSRARARRVARPLRRIAAAEKLISKEGAKLWATFTREFEAELAQISSGRRRGEPRYRHNQQGGAVWKQW